jgi:hypothetical protein
MNFFETYDELSMLNEVKSTRAFKDGSDIQFYHFYEDLADLINSLKTRRIYSNKNAQASQLDIAAPENTAYVCMTVGTEGKNRTTQNFGTRSFGISFTNLNDLCSRANYYFDPDPSGEYSQFLAKTQYDIGERGRPTATNKDPMVTAFRDFELLAIGQLSTGEYFISGGQGRSLSNHWSSKTFTDAAVYKTLRDWFLWNMDSRQLEDQPDTAQPHIYYHFKNDTIGNPTAKYKGHILNTDAQLNPNYVPRPDSADDEDSDNTKKNKKEPTYDRAMDFTLKRASGIGFKEIIGVGPFRVTDSTGQVILQMDMCKPGGKGGYQPPKVFTALARDPDYEYPDMDVPTSGQDVRLRNPDTFVSRPQHLMLSKDTAKFIAELYNESEHRVYIPNKRDMAFTPQDIETIVLPAIINADGSRTYDLQKLLSAVAYGALPDYSSRSSFLSALKTVGVVSPGVHDMTDFVYNNLTMLIQLLTTDYDDTVVEFIDKNGKAVKSLALTTPYAKASEIDRLSALPDGKGYTNNDAHMRYIPEDDIDVVDLDTDKKVKPFDIMSQIENEHTVKWEGVQSVIARIKALRGDARLGAETIIIGKGKHPDDPSRETKYVLFVDNAHKAKGFLELPGGGLHDIPVTEQSFRDVAKQRLNFKGGISESEITGFKSTGKGLLLAEKGSEDKETGAKTKGAAKSKSVKWGWSYYKLFQAYYTPEIDPNDTDYSFDNHHLLSTAAEGESGYTCYLKWIPVDSLDHNRSLITRYANIFGIIRQAAENFK